MPNIITTSIITNCNNIQLPGNASNITFVLPPIPGYTQSPVFTSSDGFNALPNKSKSILTAFVIGSYIDTFD